MQRQNLTLKDSLPHSGIPPKELSLRPLNHSSSSKLYSSQKFIHSVSDENSLTHSLSNPHLSENQIMNNLNSSIDGLFSKIQTLKGESSSKNAMKKKQNNTEIRRFPKFSPFPSFKSTKAAQNSESFDQFFKKFNPMTPKPNLHTQTKPEQKMAEKAKSIKGLLSIPSIRVSADVDEDEQLMEDCNFSKLNNLQQLVTKSTTQEEFEKEERTDNFKLEITDFELGKCVGSGKFGDVLVCKHRQTGMLFALKKIFKSTIKEYDMVNQFARELKIHYRLNHPNIVKLYTHFEDEYHVFLVMEYIEGGILMQKIKSSEDLVSNYVSQTINAVSYLHKLNIAHRDIKPENIVLQFDSLKLCDFGWSSSYDNQMKTTFCGTLDYLSPEMKDRGVYDNSVDIWAIGILTFQLITGNPPFKKQLGNWKAKGFEKESERSKWNVSYPPFISTTAESFMRSILKEQPEDRANLRVCENHLFLRKYRKNIEESPYFNEIAMILDF